MLFFISIGHYIISMKLELYYLHTIKFYEANRFDAFIHYIPDQKASTFVFIYIGF